MLHPLKINMSRDQVTVFQGNFIFQHYLKQKHVSFRGCRRWLARFLNHQQEERTGIVLLGCFCSKLSLRKGVLGYLPQQKIRGATTNASKHPMGFPHHFFPHEISEGKGEAPPAAILPVKRPTSWQQSKRAPGIHWEPKDDWHFNFASFVCLDPWKICVSWKRT